MGIAIPSIDILGGRAVRLSQGQAGTAQEFGDPVLLAKKYSGVGFGILHVVDLDAAFGGLPQFSALQKIRAACPSLKIQWAGGIRSFGTAKLALSKGAARVVFGTALATSPNDVEMAVQEFGKEKIWAALDFSGKPPLLRIRGWAANAGIGLEEAVARAESSGVSGIILSSVDSDGMEKGPDLSLILQAREKWRGELWIAGGMRGTDDAKASFAAGADGAIFGRALYRKETALEELRCLQDE